MQGLGGEGAAGREGLGQPRPGRRRVLHGQRPAVLGRGRAATAPGRLTVLTTLPRDATVEESTAVGVTTPNQGCASAAAADSRWLGS